MMYQCFRRDEDSLKHIINKMNPYIQKRGEKIVQDEALLTSPVEFSKKLLELKAEMDHMVQQSFDNDMKFQKGRDSSFMAFMNEPIFFFAGT